MKLILPHHSREMDSLVFLLVLIPVGVLPLYPSETTLLFVTRALILSYLCIKFVQDLGRLKYPGKTEVLLTPPLSPWYGFQFLWIGWGLLSLLWSVSPYTSRSVFLDFFLYISIWNLIHQVRVSKKVTKIFCQLLVGIAVLVSIDGLFQKFYRYDTYLPYLMEHAGQFDPDSLEITKNWIIALSGRVFAHFLLPSHLAGYLIMIIPLNIALIRLTSVSWQGIFWTLALGVNVTVLFFTQSYGAWLSLLLALVLVVFYPLFIKYIRPLPLYKDKKQVLKVITGFILFLGGIFIILALIGYNRGIYLWNLNAPNHPGHLRFLNWKSAFSILRDYPWTGTGLGTFKVIHSQYMFPNSNEANFVHNSYLQIASELGLPGFLAVGYVTILWTLRGLHRLGTINSPEDRIIYHGFFTSGLCFCFHNLVDYDLYIPALGLLGFMILALAEVRKDDSTFFPIPPLLSRTLLICLIGLTLWFFTLNAKLYRVENYIYQIKELIRQGDQEKAYQLVQKPLSYDARNPLLHEIAGALLLQLKQPEEAIRAFQKAIELDPQVPRLHAQLGEAYLFKGDLAGAYVEIKRATELFPLRVSYQKRLEEISSLLEKYSIKKH